MADPTVAVHKAIYTALSADLTIPVYDHVPQKASYPYVEILRHVSTQRDSLVAQKDEIVTYLTVWSDYKGQKQVLTVMEEIYNSLHRKKLTLDAGEMVRMMIQTRDTTRDVDDSTFMGNVTVSSIVEH